MQALFANQSLQPEEVYAITALLEQAGQTGAPPERAPAQVTFVFLGLAGAALLLFAFDLIWKNRLRSVRRALVESRRI
jgi:hypothetical protein